MLQQLRAHHRRQRERHERGDQNRHAERDRKFAEKPPHDIAHEQQRNQHGDQRNGQRDDREADLLGSLQRRFERLVPFLDEARDIFDHHDGVVDHEAGGNRERHQRKIVEAVAAQIHHAEGADDRQRHGDARDDRGRNAAQEKEHHHHDERDREHQFELHVFHRRADGGRHVRERGHLNRRRQRRLQSRNQILYAIRHADDVGAGLPLNVEDDGRLGVHPRGLQVVFGPVHHGCNVGEPDRCAVFVGDDQRPVSGARKKLVVVLDGEGLARAVESSLRLIDVRISQGSPEIFKAQPIGRERRRKHLHTNRGLFSAADGHQAHSGELRNLLREVGVGEVFDFFERQRVRCERERQDGRIGGIHLAVDRRIREIARQIACCGVDGRPAPPARPRRYSHSDRIAA